MNEVVLCLLSGGVAAAVIKAVESIITWKLNRKAVKEDREEARKDQENEDAKKAVIQLKKDVDSLRIGEQVILRDRIKYLGKNYIKNKEIDFEDRQDLIDMHQVYHNALGGNGNLDSLMAEVMELPLK